jgi:hypothetical protein
MVLPDTVFCGNGSVVGQLQSEPYFANLMRRQAATMHSTEFHNIDGSEGKGMIVIVLSLVTPDSVPADRKATTLI